MDNGRTKEVIAQFDAIAPLPDLWDHNRQYRKYLLGHIAGPGKNGLDIGCGTGELTKELARYCDKVLGIDVSKAMIEEAKKRNTKSNVYFQTRDVESFLEETTDTFDVIASVATFHHLNTAAVLKSLRNRLNPGGVILILDLYRTRGIFEMFLSLLAVFCNPFMYLIKRGSLFNTKEEREAWKDHFAYDEYNTIDEIRKISEAALGKVKITRHLFWRYSLIYRKNDFPACT